jgi:hypothetical protein
MMSWRVFSQVIETGGLYIAGRQRDPTQPLHGAATSNYSGGYQEDRGAVGNAGRGTQRTGGDLMAVGICEFCGWEKPQR